MGIRSTMKIWLDDLRPTPDQTWTLIKTPKEAIALLESGEVRLIRFDHDLGFDGEREMTGYEVLLWIEEAVALRGFKPPEMRVHSANPPGHERLLKGIKAIHRRVEEQPA